MSAVTGTIHAGVCGFVTQVTATSEDQQHVCLQVESTCENLTALSASLPELDAYAELGAGRLRRRVVVGHSGTSQGVLQWMRGAVRPVQGDADRCWRGPAPVREHGVRQEVTGACGPCATATDRPS